MIWRRCSVGWFCTLALGCSSTPAPPELARMEPNAIEAGVESPVSVFGTGFRPIVHGNLSDPEGAEIDANFTLALLREEVTLSLVDVRYVSKGELTATVPAAIRPGNYALELVDPRGRVASLAEAVEVHATTQPTCESANDCANDPCATTGACVGGQCLYDKDSDNDGHIDALCGGDDCDDDCAECWEGRADTCDGLDNDCDGPVDEDAEFTWYADADGDGYGDANDSQAACSQPPGYVTDASDCADAAGSDPACNDLDGALCNPGRVGLDDCDGADNDCDGNVDNDWVVDASCGVGYCHTTNSPSTCVGGVLVDCVPGTFLTPTDPTCDGIDDDCNGVADDDYPVDRGCGVGLCGITNTPSSCTLGVETLCSPGSPIAEVPDDGVDQDCSGSDTVTCFVDGDQDGQGTDLGTTTLADDGSCDAGQNESDVDTDCNDAIATIYLAAPETPDDGIDQDCNGDDTVTCFVDGDQDGQGTDLGTTALADDGSCDVGQNESDVDTDCNDAIVTIYLGAAETPDDGIDQDCNGDDTITCFVDGDQDGQGTDLGTTTLADDGSCNAGQNESDVDTDCNDAINTIYLGAAETPDDGIDQDCNGDDTITCFVDGDQDGQGTDLGTTTLADDGSCDVGQNESDVDTDCNDAIVTIYLGAAETPDDGIDQDCNGDDTITCFVDGDQDGQGTDLGTTTLADDGSCDVGQNESDVDTDCNDAIATIYLGAAETPDDGIDQDCNGFDTVTCFVDADQDGYGTDTGATVLSPDGGCDRFQGEAVVATDCADLAGSDPDCGNLDGANCHPGRLEGPTGQPSCSDGYDNDCDGVADELEPGCMSLCDGDWCWENPVPTGSRLEAVWAMATDDVWVVGEAGTILHWDGVAWSTVPSPTNNTLHYVWGLDPNDLWACGDTVLLRYNGTTWNAQLLTVPANYNVLTGTATNDVWMGGSSGQIQHFNGAGWQSENPGTGMFKAGMWAAAVDDVWVGSYGGLVEQWDGSVWTEIQPSGGAWIESVYGFAANDIYIAAWSGTIQRWNGASLDTETTPTTFHLRHVFGLNAADVWAVGDLGTIIRRTGGSWQSVAAPSNDYLYSVGGAAVDDLWVVGANGTIYHWDGAQWERRSHGPTNTIMAMWGTSTLDIWGVGTFGTVVHFNGAAWDEVTVPLSGHFNGVHGLSSTEVWVVGDSGAAMHYDGNVWTETTTNVADDLVAVWAHATDDVMAVTETGTVIHWTGSAWSTILTSGRPLRDCWGLAGELWCTADAGDLLHWTGAAFEWINTGSTETLTAIWGTATDDIWVGDIAGEGYHFNGAAWSGPVAVLPTGAVQGIWGSSQDVYWAVGAIGQVYQWGGAAWAPVETPTGSSLTSLWGSGAGDLRVGGVNGIILRR